uniref:Uncharacterized protein n=1 Tax=Amphimedon queenslandica TaxID=400682 RepID=A0A1X7U3V9_AMPQE
GIQYHGISASDAPTCKKLVAIATDGAAANIASAGLKANRLELSIKDALKGTWFDGIDNMLFQLYYLYEKSPRKSRELEGIVRDLRNVSYLMMLLLNL